MKCGQVIWPQSWRTRVRVLKKALFDLLQFHAAPTDPFTIEKPQNSLIGVFHLHTFFFQPPCLVFEEQCGRPTPRGQCSQMLLHSPYCLALNRAGLIIGIPLPCISWSGIILESRWLMIFYCLCFNSLPVIRPPGCQYLLLLSLSTDFPMSDETLESPTF